MTSHDPGRRLSCDEVHPQYDVYHPEGHPVPDTEVEYRVAWEWGDGIPDFEPAASLERAVRMVESFATADPNGRLNTRIQTRTVSQWSDR